ncbi:MAG: glycosyl hydrolase family 16 [Flavobacteriaceae bacterium]|nr:glycosyl hydrolase family 16 [Flavobacteriaceae bacterium]|tara:strand:- start:24810 stop:25655 length:846 start_codon:yes stop_codon:yes gene_type:complete
MKNFKMNNRGVYFFLLASLLVTIGCDLNETQTVTTFENLVWADEFDTPGAPDTSKWTYDIGDGTAQGIPGWGNNELQYYTDRMDNVKVENGNLVITALRESYAGANYTSGKVLTKGLFQTKYGRFEARIKLPWGQGLWPAFWLLGDDSNGSVVWPQIGEIDIMEYRGQEPTITHGTIHGPGYAAGNAVTKEYELQNDRFDTDFHVFGVEWGPDYINWYVDDVLYNQITPNDIPAGTEWVFNNNEFYMILNVAVGGTFVGLPPNANTVFPQKMYVDYVRVYQ